MRTFLLCVIALVAAPARSQTLDEGVLVVRIASRDRAAPVRVSVEPLDRPAPVAPRPAVVSAGEPWIVRGLEAGRYRIIVEIGGRSAAVEAEVAGEAIVEVTVRSSGTSKSPVARVRRWPRLGAGRVIRREDRDALPSGPLVLSLIETTDATAVADRLDGGGLAPGDPPRMSWHGHSWTQTRFALGAVDVTDPDGGRPLLVPDEAAAGGAEVVSSLASDLGAGGTLVALTLPTGSAAWRHMASLTSSLPGADPLARGSMGATAGLPPPIARLQSFGQAAGRTGGAVGSRTRLVGTASIARARWLDRDIPPRLEATVASALVRATVAPAAANLVEVAAVGQHIDRPFAGRALVTPDGREDAVLRERGAAGHAQVAWRLSGRRGAALTAAGYSRRATDAAFDAAPSASESFRPGGVVERLRDGPVPELPLPGQRVAWRWEWRAAWWPPHGTTGPLGHAAQMGDTVSVSGLESALVLPGLVGERLGGMPAFAWRFAADRALSARRSTEVGLLVGDRIAVGDRLALEVGARLQDMDGSARGASQALAWRTVSPRIQATWLPRGSDGWALGATYARSPYRLLVRDLAWGDPGAPWAERRLWRDANGNGRVEPEEVGALVALAGPGAPVGGLAPRVRPPVASEVVAATTLRIGANWSLHLLGIRRVERRLLAPVNVAVLADDYSARQVPDAGGDLLRPDDDQVISIWERAAATLGRDRYLLGNPPGHDATHEGLEFEAAWRRGRARIRLGATASRSVGHASYVGFGPTENDQGLGGDVFASPNAATFAEGRLFFDRAYTITLAGTAALPGGFGVAAVARYQDGQPFARLLRIDDLPQGPELVRAVPNGRHRFQYLLTLDGRVDKTLALGRLRLTAAVEVFNLLGARSEVEEDVLTSPSFRAVTAVQPPRVVRLSGRVAF